MPKFISHLYLIEALTNLHPGSGDANYSTVDKTVQRDPATGYPTIHSSSLKGALREYFEQETDVGASTVKYIFGDRPTEANQEANGKGAYRFFPAQLLSLPLRSNYQPYYHALSNDTLETLENLCEHLLTPDQNTLTALSELRISENTEDSFCHVFDELTSPVSIEGYPAKQAQHLSAIPENLRVLLEDRIVMFHSKDLCQITKNQLPVIARNQLENGESKNLWYEEVLPRMTRFYFFVQVPAEEHNQYADFNRSLDNKTVQIGANASVGYGYCLIKKII